MSSGEHKLTMLDVEAKCGWVISRAYLNDDVNDVVTWRMPDPEATWFVGGVREHIRVSDMRTAHLENAIALFSKKIDDGSWIWNKELTKHRRPRPHPHTYYVRAALKSVNRLEHWRLWIERWQYELRSRGN